MNHLAWVGGLYRGFGGDNHGHHRDDGLGIDLCGWVDKCLLHVCLRNDRVGEIHLDRGHDHDHGIGALFPN